MTVDESMAGVCAAILESAAFGPYIRPDYSYLDVPNPLEAVPSATAADGSLVAPPAASTAGAARPPSATGVVHGHAALANGPSPHPSPAVPVKAGPAREEPQQATLKEQVAGWTERVLVPAIQRQVPPMRPIVAFRELV